VKFANIFIPFHQPQIREGGRLEKPDTCPDDLYQLMLECWTFEKEERPTFESCLKKLQAVQSQMVRREIVHCPGGMVKWYWEQMGREILSGMGIG
jgi:hypothetical protein